MIEVKDLTVEYEKKVVVKKINFKVEKKESLGIIGESGSGKTTIARAITRLIPKTNIHSESKVIYLGKNIFDLKHKALKKARREIQIVFQDPFSSFNPRLKIGDAIKEGLEIHSIGNKKERIESVLEILKNVGLSEEYYNKYPHEFSGGQRQRIALARSLILKPALVIADEPVSALDVSVQAQILNLMLDLKNIYGLTYILIAHDLGIIDYFCDKVMVVYKGELMEYGPKSILQTPFHPYTLLLLKSLPEKIALYKKEDIQKISIQSACPFFTRCPLHYKNCQNYTGEYFQLKEQHLTSCIRAKK